MVGLFGGIVTDGLLSVRFLGLVHSGGCLFGMKDIPECISPFFMSRPSLSR